MLKILTYKMGSKSAKALAEELKVKRLKEEGSVWKGKPRDVVINWGRSRDHIAFSSPAKILNSKEAVKVAANKLLSLKALQKAGVPIPEFTESRRTAEQWANLEGVTVVCRKTLTGHSGQGIVLASRPEEVVEAPLYTEYLKKILEYRVHVFGDDGFFVQRKARNRSVPDEEVNWQIRNHQNGFIFSHINLEYPKEMELIAHSAVKALGLDFGAVDLILNSRGEMYVLEVNTACGLEGTTLTKYAEYFRQFK